MNSRAVCVCVCNVGSDCYPFLCQGNITSQEVHPLSLPPVLFFPLTPFLHCPLSSFIPLSLTPVLFPSFVAFLSSSPLFENSIPSLTLVFPSALILMALLFPFPPLTSLTSPLSLHLSFFHLLPPPASSTLRHPLSSLATLSKLVWLDL